MCTSAWWVFSQKCLPGSTVSGLSICCVPPCLSVADTALQPKSGKTISTSDVCSLFWLVAHSHGDQLSFAEQTTAFTTQSIPVSQPPSPCWLTGWALIRSLRLSLSKHSFFFLDKLLPTMLLEYSMSFCGDMISSLHFWGLYSQFSISEMVAPLRQVWYLIHFYVLGDTVPGILKINTSSVAGHCLLTHTVFWLTRSCKLATDRHSQCAHTRLLTGIPSVLTTRLLTCIPSVLTTGLLTTHIHWTCCHQIVATMKQHYKMTDPCTYPSC